MFENDGDIDDNGIPDSIQRDPVVERTPVAFGETPTRVCPGSSHPSKARSIRCPNAGRASAAAGRR